MGATRARERLVCSYVDRRYRFGEQLSPIPSRFLQAIDVSLFEKDDQSGNFGPEAVAQRESDRIPRKRPVTLRRNDIPLKADRKEKVQKVYHDEYSQDIVEFRMGQYVRHKKYGRGKIVSISGFGVDMKLTVLFNDGTRKKLMAKFANFERD